MMYLIVLICCSALCVAQSKQEMPSLTLFGITIGIPFPATYPHCSRGLPVDIRPCRAEQFNESDGEPELVNVPYQSARISVTTSNRHADGKVTAFRLSIPEIYCDESLERLR